MFEIGASEILLIAIAALIAIGPKDLPEILFRLGRLVRRVRIVMNGFRDQYAEIMHEAEINHYRKEFGAKLMDDKEINEALAFRSDEPPQPVVTPVASDAEQDVSKQEVGHDR